MSPQNLNIEMYSVSHETWQLQDDLKVVVDLWNNLRYLFSYHFLICYLISVQQFLEAGIKFIIPNQSIILKKPVSLNKEGWKQQVLLRLFHSRLYNKLGYLLDAFQCTEDVVS